jgi:ribosomal protein L40E
MITREQKNTEEDIPHDFYIRNEKENKWIAYFKFDRSKKTEICGDLSVESFELYPVLKENAIEIPDYTLFAELYAKQIDRLTNFVNLDLYPYRTVWFKVSGRTIEETQQKLIRISSSLKSHAEELYKLYKVIIDAGGKYTGMDDFVKDVVMMWKDSFSPKLDEHPIFRAKETFTKVLICPNCGSEMPLYAKYCGHCGYELSSVKLFG